MLTLAVLPAAACAGSSPAHSDQELLRRLGLGIARAIFEAAGGSLTVERGAESLSIAVKLLRSEAA